MQPLTIKQRLTVYKEMLRLYKDDRNNFGFCMTATIAAKTKNIKTPADLYDMRIDKALPELAPYKPLLYAPFWFPRDKEGITKRITILKVVIKTLEGKKYGFRLGAIQLFQRIRGFFSLSKS